MKRAALGSSVLGLIAFLIMSASSASAHTDLLFSTPADGAVLTQAPAQVVLTFNEALLPDTVQVSVEDAAGLVVIVGDARVEGSEAIATWPPGVVGPDFTVNYRVVSADGHPVTGSIGFTVVGGGSSPDGSSSPDLTASPVSGAAVPSAPEPEPSRAAVLAIGAGLAAGLGVVLFFVARARRGSP